MGGRRPKFELVPMGEPGDHFLLRFLSDTGQGCVVPGDADQKIAAPAEGLLCGAFFKGYHFFMDY